VRQKGFIPIIILAGVLVAALSFLLVFNSRKTKSTNIIQSVEQTSSPISPTVDPFVARKNPVSARPPYATPIPTPKIKTYRNDKYGFNFSYLDETNPYTDEPNSKGIVLISSDPSKFLSTLSDGSFSEDLKYDKLQNKWLVTPGMNQESADAFCPFEYFTSLQHIPYYQIEDSRSGRPWYYAYVTRSSIIVIRDIDPFYNINDTVKFDNPNDILKVSCSILQATK
jgi:hypothetical protein